jgi:hypothetical protein
VTKAEFLAQLDRASMTLGGLPVSSAMTAYLAADLRKGDPPWWKGVSKAWEGRSFVFWSEAWTQLLTAIHFEALNDAENPLVPYFPSCGGTDEADPAPGLARFLADPGKTFFENLRDRHRRSYVPARAPLWIAPAAMFFQLRDMPFYLVETNAGAGLNLAADLLSHPKGFDASLIAARIGLDPKPIVLEDIVDRRWLTAGVLPDNIPGIQAVDQAAAALMERCRREPNFVQLVECKPEIAPKFLDKNVPAEADVGLMVLNMGTTVRMTDPEYEAYAGQLAQTFAAWGDRALWVEIENVRGEMYSTTYQVRAGRMLDGAFQRQVMASIDLEAGRVDYLKEAEAFLAKGAPPRKKKSFLQFPKF